MTEREGEREREREREMQFLMKTLTLREVLWSLKFYGKGAKKKCKNIKEKVYTMSILDAKILLVVIA